MRLQSCRFLIVAAILLLAVYLRFTKLDWDDGLLSHPDDRFMSMVTQKISFPRSLRLYLNTRLSPANPHNAGFELYVYGTLPLFLAKIAANYTAASTLQEISLIGRSLSACYDSLSILVLFALGSLLYTPLVGLIAAFLLATTVLHIQHAHFFVVEPLLVCASLCAIYGACLLYQRPSWAAYAFTGGAFGAALATKITALLLLPVIALAFVLSWNNAGTTPMTKGQKGGAAVLCIVLAATLFRFWQPYAFEAHSFISLDATFLSDFTKLAKWSIPNPNFPPSIQWHDRSVLFAVENMFFWGMGPPLALLAFSGWAYALRETLIKRDQRHLLPLIFTAAATILYSVSLVKAMRYLLPAYPLFILLGSYFIVQSFKAASKPGRAAIGLLLAAHCCWTIAFCRQYHEPHTRACASAWIKEHIPPGSTLAQEHWDERLPMFLTTREVIPYQHETLEVFREDTPEKEARLLTSLEKSDYLILNSQRGYGSIPRWQEKYPSTTIYYQKLFSGSLGYELVKTFSNYPSIGGFSFCTDKAEEAFSVYDRARVFVFKNSARLGRNALKAAMQSAEGAPEIDLLSCKDYGVE